MESKLIEAIFDAVNRDRDNEQIDRAAVLTVISSFKTLITLRKPKTMMVDKVLAWTGIRNKNYIDSIGPMFMKMTNQYYEKKGRYWIEDNNALEYLDNIIHAIGKEEGSKDTWLNMEASVKVKCLEYAVN